MFNFGAGRARVKAAGALGPVEIGVVQSASVDLKVDLKELRGPYRYPVAVADGKGTASGKISFAELWPESLATILNGTLDATAAAWPQASINEQHVVGGSPGYTVTLTNSTIGQYQPGSSVVVVNIGTDVFLYTQVAVGQEAAATANNPTGGKFSEKVDGTGQLNFAAGDSGHTVFVTYLYTQASGSQNVAVKLNQIGMNSAPVFEMTLIGTGRDLYTDATQQFITRLNACLAPALKFDFKLDDFTMMDLDFQAFVDINGNLGSFFLVDPNAAVV